MPCNPAIGGTAKGHLVREIDALGGLMGLAIDATAIQFKLLNRSRGPAVWSPRAQADKRRYSEWVHGALRLEPNISWIVGRAGRLVIDGGVVAGLALESGEEYRCRALVVTTGTFLNGLVHVGREQRPSGRAGEPPSRDLAESIKSIGFQWGRLKARRRGSIDGASISRCSHPSVATIHQCRSRSRPRGSPAIKLIVTSSTRPRAFTIWCVSTSASRRFSTARSTESGRGIARRSKTR
jgi:tRNA uridine 5-carboxymethylaminomethyl modification enzyme